MLHLIIEWISVQQKIVIFLNFWKSTCINHPSYFLKVSLSRRELIYKNIPLTSYLWSLLTFYIITNPPSPCAVSSIDMGPFSTLNLWEKALGLPAGILGTLLHPLQRLELKWMKWNSKQKKEESVGRKDEGFQHQWQFSHWPFLQEYVLN